MTSEYSTDNQHSILTLMFIVQDGWLNDLSSDLILLKLINALSCVIENIFISSHMYSKRESSYFLGILAPQLAGNV